MFHGFHPFVRGVRQHILQSKKKARQDSRAKLRRSTSLGFELLETRITPATITISTDPTAGVILTLVGVTETYTPDPASATHNVNNGDIETFLDAGTPVEVDSPADSIAVAAAVDQTTGSPVSFTLSAGTFITEQPTGAIGGVDLTANAFTGIALGGANQVSSFAAANTTSGDIDLTNTATTLTLAGVQQTGASNVNIANTGDLVVNGGTVLSAGAISLSATGAMTLDDSIGSTGTGDIALEVNQGGSGANNFTLISGAGISTNSTSATAIVITVNTSSGGTGAVSLANGIGSGDGGTISITTAPGGNTTGGSITEAAGNNFINSGTNGSVVLTTATAVASSIGSQTVTLQLITENVSAIAGSGGIFASDRRDCNFTGSAAGAGAINMASLAALNLDGPVSSGTGTIALGAGLGLGSGDFTQDAGGTITTGNTSSSAVLITVNDVPGFTGSAILGADITTGAGGTITVDTDNGVTTGGSITQTAGTLSAGVGGTVALFTPTGGASGIGATGAHIQVSAGNLKATAGSGGVFIDNALAANFAATAAGAGDIVLTDLLGMTLNGLVSTSLGDITLTSGQDLTLNSSAGISTGAGATLTATAGAITDPSAGVITATSLQMTASTGIGGSSALVPTQVSILGADSTTGGVFIHNGVTTPVSLGIVGTDGVQSYTSGDVDLVNEGSINIVTAGDTVRGPDNVAVSAVGSTADVATGGQTTLAAIRVIAGGTGNVVVNAGEDILAGAPSSNGTIGAESGDVTLNAGRDVVVDGGSVVGNLSATLTTSGAVTVNAGRDVALHNDSIVGDVTTTDTVNGGTTVNALRDVTVDGNSVIGNINNATSTNGIIVNAGRDVLVTGSVSLIGDFSDSPVTINGGSSISDVNGGQINSAGGTIDLTTGAGGTITISSILDSTNAAVGGAINITTDNIALDSPAAIASASGIVTITTATASEPILLGQKLSGDLGITDAELGLINTTALVRIGSVSNTGGIDLDNGANPAIGSTTPGNYNNTLSLITSGSITGPGQIVVPNLALQAAADNGGDAVDLENAANAITNIAANVSGGDFDFVNGQTLNIAGPIDGITGLTDDASHLTVTAPTINLEANVTNGIDIAFEGDVTLAADITVTSTSNSDITFTGTVQSPGTAFALTIASGGTVIFEGDVGGGGNPLSTLDDSAGSALITTANITTTLTQTYGNVDLEAGTITLTGTTITIGGTLQSTTQSNLSIVGDAVFGGDIGDGGNAPGALQVSGTTAINAGAITTVGDQTYTGDATLGADVSITSGGNVTFGGMLTSPGTPFSLTIDAKGVTAFDGAVGSSDETASLGALTIAADGSTQINGGLVNTSNFDMTFHNDVTLGKSFTLVAGIIFFDAGLALGSSATTATSTLQVAGTLNFASTTTLTTTLAGTAPSQIGHIIVSNLTNFNNATFALNYSSFTPAPGDMFDIVSNGAFSVGQFGNVPAPGPVTLNGVPYLVTYSGSSGGSDFILTAAQPAAITSADSTDFTGGSSSTFMVVATGIPTPTLSESGILPTGVSFDAATGVLSGRPTSYGTFHLTFTAHNGVGADAVQNFTLLVGNLPAYVVTANDKFIAQVFLDLLGRTVEESAMNFWAGELDQGVAAATVVFAIERDGSNEFQTDEVEFLYQKYLRRAADPGSLASDVAFLNSGGRIEQIVTNILGSSEYFQNEGGGTNSGFLNKLYEDTLGRPIDPPTLALDLNLLSQGTSTGQIAATVVYSQEYFTDVVDDFYVRFLHRQADTAGQGFFVQQLLNGVLDEVVIASMMASPEYMSLTNGL